MRVNITNLHLMTSKLERPLNWSRAVAEAKLHLGPSRQKNDVTFRKREWRPHINAT